MSKSTLTPVGRASFPNLAKVDQYNKYSLSILFPKSDPKVMEFAKWLKEAVENEALGVAGKAGQVQAVSLFTNFKDGDNVGAFTTYRAEYAGHFILNVSRKPDFGKPCIINRNLQPIDPSEIYAGCNIIAYIDVFGYKFGSKKSVTVGIQHVMKVSDNTPFTSTGISADDAFAALDLPDEDGFNEVGPVPQSTPTPIPTPPASNNPFAGV